MNVIKCDSCEDEIHECNPHFVTDDGIKLCGDCAFKAGLITEHEYLKHFLYFVDIADRAAVHDGEIYIAMKCEKFPWEREDDGDLRNGAEYSAWRKSVFERDDYTCQRCGNRGGELNAHHIKAWKTHKAFRFDVNNGITLCASCHRAVHKAQREGVKRWKTKKNASAIFG